MRYLLTHIIFAALISSTAVAQTLFIEDFDTEAPGATTGTSAGTPGGSWSSSSSGGTFSVQGDAFNVNNTDGVWSSNPINISSAGYAILNVSFFGIGLFDADDNITAYYILDNNGVEVKFGEFIPFLIGNETQGSAIVSGSTVQLVIRGFDDSPNIFGTGFMQFDDVTITAADVLYSRKSGTWTDMSGGFGGTGTWSTDRSGTPACGCVPLNDVVAVVQSGHTVTIPISQSAVGAAGTPNLAPGGVDVENGGILQFNANGVTLGIQAGLFRVRNGGTVNSSSGAVTGETVSFNADVGGATLMVDAGATMTIENLMISDDASNFHYISGGGTLAIQNDITVNSSGASLTNNLTSSLAVTDRIQFAAGVTGSTVVNNQNISANMVFYDDANNSVANNGTMALQDIVVNANSDDNNTFSNTGSLALNSATISIDANSANFFINNSGTIDQKGNFADLVAASNYINQSSGVWRWELNANAIPANFANVLDCSAAGNTFVYNGTANQNIAAIPYHNLILSTGGNKSLSAALDVNGDLSIENATTLAGGGNAMDVEGDVTITGSGVLAGTGAINIAGSWSAAGPGSFTEGTRTVTFDGTTTSSILNSSGNESFYSLTLNKSAAATTVTLQNEISVSQTLTLTRGRLVLNGNAVRVTRNNNGAITGASANGFIVSETTASPYGRVIWTTGATNATFTFPFGTTGGSYIPYSLVKTAGTAAAGTVSVATYGTGAGNTPYPATVTHTADAAGIDQSGLVVDRYWIVNTSGYTSVTASQNLTFAASEATGVTSPRAAQRWDGSSTWTPKVGNSSANPFPVPSANLASSSIWVVVSNTIALPVEWLDFDVRLKNHEVEISWKTALESNNDFFTVERAQDIENFETVAIVQGKGTSQTVSSYSVMDPNPMHGITYYRVKQTDFDGTVSHSNLQRINYEGPEFAFLNVYPSPGNGKSIKCVIKGLRDRKSVHMQIYNSQGVMVRNQVIPVTHSGYIEEEITFLNGLPPGVYVARAGQTLYLTEKFLVE